MGVLMTMLACDVHAQAVIYANGTNLTASGTITATNQNALLAVNKGTITGNNTLNVTVNGTNTFSYGASAIGVGSLITLNGGTFVDNNPTSADLDVRQGATINATGVAFRTTGYNSPGAYIADPGSSATLTNDSFNTAGQYSNGVDITQGNATLSGSSIKTTGVGSFGVISQGSGAIATVTGGSITVLGAVSGGYGSGVAAENGGSLTLQGGAIVNVYGASAPGALASAGTQSWPRKTEQPDRWISCSMRR
ncbi:hypothetical protein DWU98_00005 [Dyella monticola]|uniref:Autotransporter outer membrane beta-barrel domain-containing protein n=2 Tax=Dyella monticola TaxID=1927958 RepID=A0A370X7R7_9GAMM|nr:hypothetical protein DWU98_00005 [Dyella monticola]